MEVQKFWTKTKVIILLILLLIIGLIIGGIFLRRHYLKKEYIKLESFINNNVDNYLKLEGIVLEDGEYRKINIVDIYKKGLAQLASNKYQDDCIGYSIVEVNKLETENKTYIKCKNIYVSKGYGTEATSNKKENTSVAQSVKDTIAPVIKLIGKEKMTIGLNETFEDPGATAMDNIDKDITKKIKVSGKVDITKEGSYTLSYTVSDKAGNKSSLSRIVVVDPNKKVQGDKDEIAPVITFKNPDATQKVCINAKIDTSKEGIYGYSAYDDVDKDVTDNVKIEGNTSSSTEGTFKITYKVSDKAGNETIEYREYQVVNCDKPSTPVVTPTETPKQVEPTPQPTNPDPTPTEPGSSSSSSSSEPAPSNPTPSQTPAPVIINVTGVSISNNSLYLEVGEVQNLGASVIPSSATNKTLTYSSLNPSVATVDGSGNVRGVKSGTTRIIVTSSNGRQAAASVTVE